MRTQVIQDPFFLNQVLSKRASDVILLCGASPPFCGA